MDPVRKLQKIINKDENVTEKRLRSLRLPRDLSLGGTKSAKKFAPNINVVRNKDNKLKEFPKKNDAKRKNKQFENKKNSFKNDQKQKYIQSQGVFAEGGSFDLRKSARFGGKRGEKDNDAVATMTVPTINKRSWKVNKQEEESVLNTLMADDEEEIDEKLPFAPVTWNEKDLLCEKVPIKNEIKTEVIDDAMENPLQKLKLENLTLPVEYQDNNRSDHKPSLSLWKLPDSFAGRGPDDSPDYCLKNMPEGQIGKILVRKSGRIEVLIGGVRYDLEDSGLDMCTEMVVSLSEEDKVAAVLGQIENRYLLNPDWDSLLHKYK